MSEISTNVEVERPVNNVFQLKFSEEDMVILRQCSRESFYERCLPLSGIFGLLTYYAVRTGYWQPSKRFGALPKIALAVGLAFYAGKLSYRDECIEKFMQSSNSKVGEFLREKFNRSPPKSVKSETAVEKNNAQNVSDEINTSSDSQVDAFRNFSDDLNFQSFLQPSTSQMPAESFARNDENESTNEYEDRRKKNREEYSKREQLKKKHANPKSKRENKNQYGDIID